MRLCVGPYPTKVDPPDLISLKIFGGPRGNKLGKLKKNLYRKSFSKIRLCVGPYPTDVDLRDMISLRIGGG
jgi:hypothetical protein